MCARQAEAQLVSPCGPIALSEVSSTALKERPSYLPARSWLTTRCRDTRSDVVGVRRPVDHRDQRNVELLVVIGVADRLGTACDAGTKNSNGPPSPDTWNWQWMVLRTRRWSPTSRMVTNWSGRSAPGSRRPAHPAADGSESFAISVSVSSTPRLPGVSAKLTAMATDASTGVPCLVLQRVRSLTKVPSLTSPVLPSSLAQRSTAADGVVSAQYPQGQGSRSRFEALRIPSSVHAGLAVPHWSAARRRCPPALSPVGLFLPRIAKIARRTVRKLAPALDDELDRRNPAAGPRSSDRGSGPRSGLAKARRPARLHCSADRGRRQPRDLHGDGDHRRESQHQRSP